jgi:LacI family transcriptional regulator
MAETRPTLRSLAQAAGVSATTMSHALRGNSEVSAATRQRLTRFALARGYRPNPLVAAVYSQVRTRKTQGDHAVLGYLNTWWPKPAWEGCSTKTGQFEGAARRAHELGFQLENFWLKEPGMSPARLTQILKTRGVRGLIVGPLENLRETPELPWSDFALVALGYSLHTPAVSRVSHAHFGAMNRAMEELIARGYRRIGYVTSADFEARVSLHWGAAFRLNQHKLAGRHWIEPLLVEGSVERGALRRWLKATQPEVVVTPLPQVYERIRELGLCFPDDLGFVHLDLPNALRAKGVTGIDQLWQIMGAAAVDLLANQLFTNNSGVPEHPLTQLVEGAWLEGRTLRAQVRLARA